MSFAKDYGVSDLATKAAAATSKQAPFAYMTADPTDPLRRGSAIVSAAPVSAPPPSGGGGGGGPAGSISIPGIDYKSLIEADPNYIAYENSSQQNLANAATNRRAAIRALVEQYGGLPAGLTDTYGDLSSADLEAAGANPYSQQAQLERSYQQNTLAMKRALAARGALHSGDLGYQQSQLDTQKGQSQYDLANQFSSALQGAIGSYLGAVSGDNSARDTAVSQAMADINANPLYQTGAGGSANLVSDWQSRYGTPVYQDGVGNLYTVDGNGNAVPYFGS